MVVAYENILEQTADTTIATAIKDIILELEYHGEKIVPQTQLTADISAVGLNDPNPPISFTVEDGTHFIVGGLLMFADDMEEEPLVIEAVDTTTDNDGNVV